MISVFKGAYLNITFLIGNGFDLNLGLFTRYCDFFEHYRVKNQNDSNEVKDLKDSINLYLENSNNNLDIINWSNAELALGQYTCHFSDKDNGDQAISNCHLDLCTALSNYLINEEKRFDISSIKKDKSLMKNIWSGFLNFSKGLRPVDCDYINKYISSKGDGFSLSIVDFNYTNIVDKITDCLTQEGIPGIRRFHGNDYNNKIYPIVHVHGTTTHGMAFGVNDESQFGKDIFLDSEPERKWQLIKPKFNEYMGENIDRIAWDAIKSAQIIYVYGMSLGTTDKRWWERVVKHLNNNNEAMLIVHQYSSPSITLSPMKYIRVRRHFREMILSYGESLNQNQINSIQERIFLTGGNIFDCLTDFVKKGVEQNV